MIAILLAVAVAPTTAIDAERAFAADAQTLGQWTAFEKWAHPDAVLVGRNLVNARQLAKTVKNPTIAIAWWPAQSIGSCDGSAAVNSGPYYSAEDGSFGQFNTFWAKVGAEWRYRLDMGVPTEAPLPAGEAPKILIASCSGKPPVDAGAPQDARMTLQSNDATLQAFLVERKDGARALIVRMWDGQRYADVLRVEKPPRQ